jgi:hypothetical protein
MSRRSLPAFLSVVSLALLAGCGDKPAPKPAAPAAAAHEEHKAPHGGEILELGEEEAHLEMIHDAKTGSLTVYVYGKSLEAPAAVASPTILLASKDGPAELKLTAVEPKADGTATQWKVTDPRLAADPLDGRIRVTVDGKQHQSPLEPAGHDHK